MSCTGFHVHCLPFVKVGLATKTSRGFAIQDQDDLLFEFATSSFIHFLFDISGVDESPSLYYPNAKFTAEITYNGTTYDICEIDYTLNSGGGLVTSEVLANKYGHDSRWNPSISGGGTIATYPPVFMGGGWDTAPDDTTTHDADFIQVSITGYATGDFYAGVDGFGEPVFNTHTNMEVTWVFRVQLSGTPMSVSGSSSAIKSLLDAINMSTQEFPFEIIPAPDDLIAGTDREDTYTDKPKALAIFATHDGTSVTYETSVVEHSIPSNATETTHKGAMEIPMWAGYQIANVSSSIASPSWATSGVFFAQTGGGFIRGGITEKGAKSHSHIPTCSYTFHTRVLERQMDGTYDVDLCEVMQYDWKHKLLFLGDTGAGYTPTGYDWDTLAAANQFVQISETSCP